MIKVLPHPSLWHRQPILLEIPVEDVDELTRQVEAFCDDALTQGDQFRRVHPRFDRLIDHDGDRFDVLHDSGVESDANVNSANRRYSLESDALLRGNSRLWWPRTVLAHKEPIDYPVPDAFPAQLLLSIRFIIDIHPSWGTVDGVKPKLR